MAHFYEKTDSGVEPRHFVSMASRPGELRPTRITDARKNGWYPSVTTVMGMLDKPALNDWRITEHLKVAYEWAETWGKPSDISDYTLDEWMREIKECAQEALDKAPKDGTDFHDVLERYFTDSNQTFSDKEREICEKIDFAIANAYGKELGISEQSFVHPMGFAGKVDLHSDVAQFVVDFKTKNNADKWKPGKMAYPEMAMQLAAYRVGLGLDNARCANVFICLENGEVEFHEWDNEELDKQWANFSDLLRIWLRNAEYVPGSK